MMARQTCVALLVLTAAGCNQKQLEAPPPPEFPVVLHVDADPGVPLPGVELSRKDEVLGTTNAAGDVELTFLGTEGDVYEIKVKCPADHVGPAKPMSVPLRRLLDNRKPHYSSQCVPNIRKLVVALRVDTDGKDPVAHVPVYYTSMNQFVGTTDESGALTAVFNVRPGDPFELKLQTSGSNDKVLSALRPPDPTLQVLAKGYDDVAPVSYTFSVLKPKVVAAPKPNIPVPIGPTRRY